MASDRLSLLIRWFENAYQIYDKSVFSELCDVLDVTIEPTDTLHDVIERVCIRIHERYPKLMYNVMWGGISNMISRTVDEYYRGLYGHMGIAIDDTVSFGVLNVRLIKLILTNGRMYQQLMLYIGYGVDLDMYDPKVHTLLLERVDGGYVEQGIYPLDKFDSKRVKHSFEGSPIKKAWFIPDSKYPEFHKIIGRKVSSLFHLAGDVVSSMNISDADLALLVSVPLTDRYRESRSSRFVE